jgi:hypothetical protein
MVLAKEEAEQLVYTRIKDAGSHAAQTAELVIMHELTIEKEYGWVFFYQTKKYLKAGDILDALAGNAPLIVNKFTGEIIETGTANPIEDYIAEYEAQIGHGV